MPNCWVTSGQNERSGVCFRGPGLLVDVSLKLGPSDPLPWNILHQATRGPRASEQTCCRPGTFHLGPREAAKTWGLMAGGLETGPWEGCSLCALDGGPGISALHESPFVASRNAHNVASQGRLLKACDHGSSEMPGLPGQRAGRAGEGLAPFHPGTAAQTHTCTRTRVHYHTHLPFALGCGDRMQTLALLTVHWNPHVKSRHRHRSRKAILHCVFLRRYLETRVASQHASTVLTTSFIALCPFTLATAGRAWQSWGTRGPGT